MEFELGDSVRKIPNGAVLLLGIRYPGNGKTFTYAALKAGGLWYLTGAGKVPTAAGWGAVERWLSRDGRELAWIEVASDFIRIWPKAPAITAEPTAEPADDGELPSDRNSLREIEVKERHSTERRRGTEWRTHVRTPEDDALGPF